MRVPLGDFFLPDPELVCPLCGEPIAEWEGFGGPGAFLVFRQGRAEPVEQRIGSQDAGMDARLPDGRIALFGACKSHHSTMAEAIVEDGAWRRVEVIDVEAADPLPLAAPWVLWRASGGRFAISTQAPTAAQGVVPAPITAVGFDDACIIAVRDGEWFVVDLGASTVMGPIPDNDLPAALAERGLSEPAVMQLPEDVKIT